MTKKAETLRAIRLRLRDRLRQRDAAFSDLFVRVARLKAVMDGGYHDVLPAMA